MTTSATGTVRDWLVAAGWEGELLEEAWRVALCESGHTADARGDSGGSLGLFQLNPLWFFYAGVPLEQWADPIVNARVALVTYWYDVGRGYAPWTQWTCKP